MVGDAAGVDEPAYRTIGKKISMSVGSSRDKPPKGKSKQMDKGKIVKD